MSYDNFRSAWVPAGVPYVAPTVYGTTPAFAPGAAPAYAPYGAAPVDFGYGAPANFGYAGVAEMSNLGAGTPQFMQEFPANPNQYVVPAVSPAVLGAAPTVTAGGVVPTQYAGTIANPVVPPTASYVRPAAPQFAEATQYARYVHPFPRQRTQARETRRGFGLVDSWRRQANPEELHAWVYNPTPPSDDYF